MYWRGARIRHADHAAIPDLADRFYLGLPWQKLVKHDPAFERPTEPAQLVGRADKIRRTLGWKPGPTFREVVHEMVEAELDAIDPRR